MFAVLAGFSAFGGLIFTYKAGPGARPFWRTLAIGCGVAVLVLCAAGILWGEPDGIFLDRD